MKEEYKDRSMSIILIVRADIRLTVLKNEEFLPDIALVDDHITGLIVLLLDGVGDLVDVELSQTLQHLHALQEVAVAVALLLCCFFDGCVEGVPVDRP